MNETLNTIVGGEELQPRHPEGRLTKRPSGGDIFLDEPYEAGSHTWIELAGLIVASGYLEDGERKKYQIGQEIVW